MSHSPVRVLNVNHQQANGENKSLSPRSDRSDSSSQDFTEITFLDDFFLKTGAEPPIIGSYDVHEIFEAFYPPIFRAWVSNGHDSEMACRRLLFFLDIALSLSHSDNSLFISMVEMSGSSEFIQFLNTVTDRLVDREMFLNVGRIDVLLLNLAISDVTLNINILHEFVESVPFFRGIYLGEHSKRIEELLTYIHSNEERTYDEMTQTNHIVIHPHYLSCLHFPPRKIIVSNAPPVKLRRSTVRKRDKYECDPAAGGLVSGIKPSLGVSDVWVAYLDPTLIGLDRIPTEYASKIFKRSIRIPAAYRRSSALTRHSSQEGLSGSASDEDSVYSQLHDFLYEKAENDFMSLQKQLDVFAQHNFSIDPLIILKDDHVAFYNGISNGLFWPAFHNLPEYILTEYKDSATRLNEDWLRYIKVNFHFAIHTSRSCRTQDFVWIHDYHLFLVGQMLRSLDDSLNTAFFLHIPFRLSDAFVSKFNAQAISVLRGLLGFKRVGFQTSGDCDRFVHLIQKHIPGSEVTPMNYWRSTGYTVRCDNGQQTDIGTFPISVTVRNILLMANASGVDERVAEKRLRIMSKCRAQNGRLFLSVERFDYTKGILERLAAVKEYFKRNTDRVGIDIFYQIAASSRGDVAAYKKYQSAVMKVAAEINEIYGDPTTGYTPVVIDTKNNPHQDVVELYKVADSIVVTPIADGMNLVIKEAILCNPAATYVLSPGAGAERQFADAGLRPCYILIEDIKRTDAFAAQLAVAAHRRKDDSIAHGQTLFEFCQQDDISMWMTSYVDPQWTSGVLHQRLTGDSPKERAKEIEKQIEKLQRLRARINEDVVMCRHISDDAVLSYKNMIKELNDICSGEGVAINLGDTSLLDECSARRIILGLQLDINMVAIQRSQHSTYAEYYKALLEASGTSSKDFEAQMNMVSVFLSEMVHVDMLVVNLEDTLMPAASSSSSWATYLQTQSAALFMYHFGNRYADELIMFSDELSADEIDKATCFPASDTKFYSTEGVMKSLHGGHGSKTIMLICGIERHSLLIDQCSQAAKELYVIPMARSSPVKSGTGVIKMPTAVVAVHSPEVLYAAMIKGALKPVSISGL